jgi:hypothetical protein
MARKISTFPLFKNTQCGTQGAQGTSLSDVIDLRDLAPDTFSMTYALSGTGGAGTAGSALFSYAVSPTPNGTFIAAGTFGTFGAAPVSGVIAFSPILAPFMKIQGVTGTSNATLLTAELHVR